jgi:hypothetical protein
MRKTGEFELIPVLIPRSRIAKFIVANNLQVVDENSVKRIISNFLFNQLP